jgi:hypothetical protein
VNIQNVVRRLVESIDIINEIAIISVTNTSTRISEISIISSSCGPVAGNSSSKIYIDSVRI